MFTASLAVSNAGATAEPAGKGLAVKAINPSGSDEIVASFLCLFRTHPYLGFGHKSQFRLQQRPDVRWLSAACLILVQSWAEMHGYKSHPQQWFAWEPTLR